MENNAFIDGRSHLNHGFREEAVPTYTVSFRVPGQASGKARPRVVRGGQLTYTPDPGGFVKRVAEAGVVCRQELGVTMMEEGAVWMTVLVKRAMPKDWSRARKERERGLYAVRTPDLVNIAAAVCDALEGVFYSNDNQVAALSAAQTWADVAETEIRLLAPW